MSRSGPGIELKALKRTLAEVRSHFLLPHLGPPTLKPPKRKEVLDCAACVVLIHGALENFVEGLALWVLGRAVQNWTQHRKVSVATASLLLHAERPKEPMRAATAFDMMRKALDGVNTDMSKAIHGNHGVSGDNLQALFAPLGVTLPSDPTLKSSLEQLIALRHQWAHQDRRRAKVDRSASDVEHLMNDSIAWATELSRQVSLLKP